MIHARLLNDFGKYLMGGYGSTRWGGHSPRWLVGEYLAICAPRTRRTVNILDYSGGCFVWPELGHSVPYVVHRQGNGFRLELILGHGSQSVALVDTQPFYGGRRWWFECPQCDRRSGRLYRRSGGFRCRLCLGLVYESSQIHRSIMEGFIKANNPGVPVGRVLEAHRAATSGRTDARMVASARPMTQWAV